MIKRSHGWCLVTTLLLFNLPIIPCAAQSGASGSVSVTATVVRGIAVTGAAGLSFGALVRDSGVHSVQSTDPNVGSFSFSGQPETNVSVSLPGIVQLSDGVGHQITFNSSMPIWNTSDSQTSGSQSFSQVSGGSAALGSTGSLFLWFGGSVNTNGVTPGSYSGIYTVSISY